MLAIPPHHPVLTGTRMFFHTFPHGHLPFPHFTTDTEPQGMAGSVVILANDRLAEPTKIDNL
jgi:hypothetical protein